MAERMASRAQAKLLARLWGDGHFRLVNTDGYIEPTVRACIRHGWLISTGIIGSYPSDKTGQMHQVSQAGLVALSRHLAWTTALSGDPQVK